MSGFYNINFTNSSANTPIRVNDGEVNTSDTDLTFVGKNFVNYSQFIGENFLHLLENFANATAPSKPIKGQLWYDTNPDNPLLKIYDGTTWKEAGSIRRETTQPSNTNSIKGDLWVDATNQQLYLFTGSTWVLVGPQFNETSTTGFKTEEIIDRATDLPKLVITFFVEEQRVAIISKYEFIPKLVIEGFSVIKQGITLSSQDFDFDGILNTKFWGTSEKADALVVGNNVVPAANFLRGDVTSTTNFSLNIRNGSGLNLGPSLETSLTSTPSSVILHQKTQGNILFRTSPDSTSFNDVLRITSTSRVGININPTEALEVNGNILTNGIIKTTNETDSTSTSTGSIVVSGGLGVEKTLNVGVNLNVNNSATLGPNSTTPQAVLFPKVTEVFDIGDISKKFRNIFVKNVEADVVGKDPNAGNGVTSFRGVFNGNLNGTASALDISANFKMTGDVNSNVVPFDGGIPAADRSILTVARALLSSGSPETLSDDTYIITITTTEPHGYVTGYYVSVTCSDTSFNISSAEITVTGLTTFTYVVGPSTVVSQTSATGTVSVLASGTFRTVINDNFINSKLELAESLENDYFLVYRSTAVPALRKIAQSTLFSSLGTVPVGSIMPFAGTTVPRGYLLCDGSEQYSSLYPELFNVIGYTYKNQNLLKGINTFALPDLRGRFAMGRETMDNLNSVNYQTTANNVTRAALSAGASTATFTVSPSNIENGPFQVGRALVGTGLDVSVGPAVIQSITTTPTVVTLVVTMSPQPADLPSAVINLSSIGLTDANGGNPNPPRTVAASTAGNVGGTSQTTISLNQIPDHEHDLKDDSGNQFYAIRNSTASPSETDVVVQRVHYAYSTGLGLTNSGGVKSVAAVQQPLDLINPYLTINYIIYTGRISNDI